MKKLIIYYKIETIVTRLYRITLMLSGGGGLQHKALFERVLVCKSLFCNDIVFNLFEGIWMKAMFYLYINVKEGNEVQDSGCLKVCKVIIMNMFFVFYVTG